MQFKINGQQPFQILSDSFSISPSLEGYMLQISADGENYSDLFQVSPNTTKMCTGMANGSFYRLSGNNSEVIVNWRTTCKGGEGGGGGQYILPPATEQTLGGIKVGDGLSITNDGTLSTSGSGGGSGVVYVNHLSDTEAVAAEVGTLIVLNNEDPTFANATWSNNTYSLEYGGLEEDIELARWDWYGVKFYLYMGENGQFYLKQTLSGEDDVIYNMDSESGSFTPSTPNSITLTYSYTSASHFNLSFNQYILNESINNISPINEHTIYIKVQGGEVAHWNGYESSTQTVPFELIYDDYEDFVNFADGQALFAIKYRYNQNYRYAVVDKEAGAIILYSDTGFTTEVTRATYLGNEVQFQSDQSSWYISIQWKEDEITIRPTNYLNIDNLMDFSTEGVHYHRITDPTKATASNLGIGTSTQNGIPMWNNEGIIIGQASAYGVRTFYYNTTGTSSSNKVVLLTDGTSTGPNRFFTPTQGGTQGQVLASNGDAEPVWETRIKAVKITSDAYEALAVKDPNTLYLIDDNV